MAFSNLSDKWSSFGTVKKRWIVFGAGAVAIVLFVLAVKAIF